MPTILRHEGFNVSIRTNDHNPAHVHVSKAGKAVKIDLAPFKVSRVDGMPFPDIVAAVRIVEDKLELLLGEWRRIHG